jgi:hypothetical protein
MTMLSGLLLTSCEKKLDIELPDPEKSIVLNALMHEDSIVYARFTRLSNHSNGFAEEQIHEVELYEDDIWKERLTKTIINGLTYYKSQSKTLRGRRYKIIAETSVGIISGEDRIPSAIEIVNASLVVMSNSEGTTYAKMKFSIKDTTQQNNYFRFRVLDTTGSNGAELVRPFLFSSQNNATNDFSFLEQVTAHFENVIYKDGNYEYALDIEFEDSIHPLVIEVTTLTPSSFNYLKTSFQANQFQNNPLIESMPVYSNIYNGLGIVGGTNKKKRLVKF